MNIFSAVETSYITPCRSIETILVKNEQGIEKVVFVYNYEAYHFRVFRDVFELFKFFNDEDCNILAEYSTERGLDNFLARLDIT